jgi:hypothetical protein
VASWHEGPPPKLRKMISSEESLEDSRLLYNNGSIIAICNDTIESNRVGTRVCGSTQVRSTRVASRLLRDSLASLVATLLDYICSTRGESSSSSVSDVDQADS